MTLTLTHLNQLDQPAFTTALAAVFEHSPWIAEAAWQERPFATPADLVAALHRAMQAASEADKIALLRAHPDLAGKLARAGTLTDYSAAEQAGLGLDRLSDAEFTLFDGYNRTYREKFGFPFIIAVRDNSRASILAAFEQRLGNNRDQEYEAALMQVARIGELRLLDLLR